MNYRREIDGLRAVAVMPVIFFHGGVPVFCGGYVGVDVFFCYQRLSHNNYHPWRPAGRALQLVVVL